jgi:hypothetical protein
MSNQPAPSDPAYAPYSGTAPMPMPTGGYGTIERQPAMGPIGVIRPTGVTILLTIVTLGFYSWYWFFKTHEEMKRHSGQGLGGPLALVIAFFIGIVMPYLTSNEVGELYARRGQHPPVSGLTGLWYFPGVFLVIGPIVWFVKTNKALNAYWRSLGAVG